MLKQPIFCVIVSCIFAYFNSFYSEHLGEAAFCDSYKHSSSFVLVCICTKKKLSFKCVWSIFIRINNKYINIIWTAIKIRINNPKYSINTIKYSSFCFGVSCKENCHKTWKSNFDTSLWPIKTEDFIHPQRL